MDPPPTEAGPASATTTADTAAGARRPVAPLGSEESREQLLSGLVGFGSGTTGGLDGELYRVRNLDDSGPGSLRAGAEAEQPLWIVFDVDGTIALRSPLHMGSDKTIDGRQRAIRVTGNGIQVRRVENIVISDIRLANGKRDAIDISGRSRRVWVHHVAISNFADGAVDITRGATDVTVSWSRFTDQTKVMLIGADEGHEVDSGIRVTLHHNLFEGTGQRHPRLRWGWVHAFNNVISHWESFGMAASQLGQLRAERNVFMPGPNSEEAIKTAAGDTYEGYVALFENTVIGPGVQDPGPREPERVFDPREHYAYRLDAANEELAQTVRLLSGPRTEPAVQ